MIDLALSSWMRSPIFWLPSGVLIVMELTKSKSPYSGISILFYDPPRPNLFIISICFACINFMNSSLISFSASLIACTRIASWFIYLMLSLISKTSFKKTSIKSANISDVSWGFWGSFANRSMFAKVRFSWDISSLVELPLYIFSN